MVATTPASRIGSPGRRGIEVHFGTSRVRRGVTADGYDGIVYDLDGTLVRLCVDWDAAANDIEAIYRRAGIDVADQDLWELFDTAEDHGLSSAVEATLSGHEREGARRSTRLPAADDLATTDRAVAVCSLNSEAACRIALEIHDLARHVQVVVGRDTTDVHKPDPGSLLAAVERLGVPRDRVVFVGDSQRDELTATRANVAFEYVGDGPSRY